jgi:hypothetical protein
MGPKTVHHLFVWRGGFIPDLRAYREVCPYCSIACWVNRWLLTKSVDGVDREDSYSQCPLCGWRSEYSLGDNTYISADTIQAFDINSTEVALTELGTHLKQTFADIYALDPRRFERVIADVFRAHSYRAMLTKQSHDGGVDVFLLNERSGAIEAVVQCKRYAPDRSVGIGAVQRLVGTAVEWGARKAYLVTTSHFTKSARKSEQRVEGTGRIELDLFEASDVLSLLQVYNETLPPLHMLTLEAREAIILGNGGSLPSRPEVGAEPNTAAPADR